MAFAPSSLPPAKRLLIGPLWTGQTLKDHYRLKGKLTIAELFCLQALSLAFRFAFQQPANAMQIS